MKTLVCFATLAAADETDTLLQANRLQQSQGSRQEPRVRGDKGEYSPCSFAGASFQNMKEDCTNSDFFAWKGGEKDPYVDPTYDPSLYGSDEFWETLQANATGGWETLCVAYVNTRKHGGTCKQWCQDQSTPEQPLVCNKGMDDAHWQTEDLYKWLNSGDRHFPPTQCTLFPSGADRTGGKNRVIDQSENGCNAIWNTQICGCAKVRKPVDPDEPPRLCSWKKSAPSLPKNALQDCTYGDYHLWKGGAKETFAPPTYPPTMYGSDHLWTTKESMGAPVTGQFPGACVAYANTKGKNCKHFCKKEGMTCVGGMDDAHHQRKSLLAWQSDKGYSETSCTLYPSGHDRQSQEDNGCNQKWKTQICACA